MAIDGQPQGKPFAVSKSAAETVIIEKISSNHYSIGHSLFQRVPGSGQLGAAFI
jgi:hypothetical protein